MSFIKSFLANWKYGKASAKIKKKEYREAIKLLEEILCYENKNSPEAALVMFDLGYCYYKCHENEAAISFFSKSYNVYKRNEENLKNSAFCSLLSHYSYLLRKQGDYELAEQISEEEKKLKQFLKKTETGSGLDL